MRNQLFLLLLIAFTGCFSSCSSCSSKKEEKEKMSILGLTLYGEHKLRKLDESTGGNATTRGSFFLFSGGMSSNASYGPIVSFAWQSYNGDYILSTLPFNKIRIRMVEKIDTPVIKFRWSYGESSGIKPDDIDRIMQESIIYAVIYIQKDDWPQEIYLPMNSKN